MTQEQIGLSILRGMVNKGWSEEDAYGTLLDQANRGGAFLQQMHARNAGRARKYLKRQYALQMRFVAENPSDDAQNRCFELVQYRDAASRGGWGTPGAAGVSDRLVLRTLTDLAFIRMHPLVRASMRQLSLATDLGLSTVERSLKRLQADEWLEVAKPAQGEQAATYRLLVRRDRTRTGDSVPYGGDRRTSVHVVSTAHPLFGPKGVGPGAAETFTLLPPRVLPLEHGRLVATNRLIPVAYKDRAALAASALEEEAASLAGLSIAQVVQAHPGRITTKTARRHLMRLRQAGLAFSDPAGHWWRYISDMDGLAAYLSIPDTRWEKQARYDRQRFAYWDYLVTPEGRRQRRTDLVRLRDGADWLYATVDDQGTLTELGRRLVTDVERREHVGYWDEATGTA